MGKFNTKNFKSNEEPNGLSIDWQQLIQSFKSQSVEDALKTIMDKVFNTELELLYLMS